MTTTLASEAVVEDAAVDAARVAFALAISFETSERLILHAADFDDVKHAVRAALKARAAAGAGYERRVIDIDAQYSVHGSFLDEHASLGCGVDGNVEGPPLVALVSVKTKYTLSYWSGISVTSDLTRAVEELESDDGPRLSMTIFIIEEPEG